jgi:Domain of unknown function (DUF4398)
MKKLIDTPPRLRRLAPWSIGAAVLLLGACASTPPPKAEMAVGSAAVERASGPAAAEAPVELAAARDKMSRAQVANAEKNYVLARQLAEQAAADATLAEAQARSVRSTRALAEVRAGLNQLRDETVRK